MLMQFYRVEVKVLPPEADAAPRTRSVLRRFSHFTKLYSRVSACSQTHLGHACMKHDAVGEMLHTTLPCKRFA